MNNIIKTDKSFLNAYSFKDKALIRDCIKDIKPNLIEYPKIIVYGKLCYQRRSIAFVSDESIGYKYSGQLAKSIRLTPNLKLLLDTINSLFNCRFNGILVNYYKDGNDYISRHSDDEVHLDNIGVVTLSFGATRKFRIRDKQTGKILKDIPLLSHQIIHMGGEFQKEFTHEIPIEKRIGGERYSFTFRNHKI